MSIRATVQDETSKIQEYIRKMAPKDELLSECLRQQKPDESEEKEIEATDIKTRKLFTTPSQAPCPLSGKREAEDQ